MSDTSVDEADVAAAGGGEPSEQTSRLPKIRRHDEFYSDHGMVGAPDPGTPAGHDAPPGTAEAPAASTDSPTDAGGSSGDTDTTAPHPAALIVPTAAPVTPAPSAPVESAERFHAAPASTSSAELAETEAVAASDVPVVRPKGAGWAGVLGIGGLTTAAIGLLGLPLQQQTGRTEIFFGQLRAAAADERIGSLTGARSTSLAGDEIATTFWRYGVLGVLGGLAALLILTLAWAPTRRIGGALTFLGALGALVYGALAAMQTNRYASALIDQRAEHMQWGDWKIGFWVGAGGVVLVAAAGMNALVGRRPPARADNDDD